MGTAFLQNYCSALLNAWHTRIGTTAACSQQLLTWPSSWWLGCNNTRMLLEDPHTCRRSCQQAEAAVQPVLLAQSHIVQA